MIDSEPAFTQWFHSWDDEIAYYYAMQRSKMQLFDFVMSEFEDGDIEKNIPMMFYFLHNQKKVCVICRMR